MCDLEDAGEPEEVERRPARFEDEAVGRDEEGGFAAKNGLAHEKQRIYTTHIHAYARIYTRGNTRCNAWRMGKNAPKQMRIHLPPFNRAQHLALHDIQHVLPDGLGDPAQAEARGGGGIVVREGLRGGREPDLEQLLGAFEGAGGVVGHGVLGFAVLMGVGVRFLECWARIFRRRLLLLCRCVGVIDAIARRINRQSAGRTMEA